MWSSNQIWMIYTAATVADWLTWQNGDSFEGTQNSEGTQTGQVTHLDKAG